jgi:hypothetical protein
VDGGDRQLARVEPRPGVAAVAVDRGLQIELADALKGADEKRVDRDQGPGVGRLDVALVELGREALQQPGLLFAEFDLALRRRRLLQTQQPLVLGEQAVALPHPAHAARGHLDALKAQLLLDPGRAVAGMRQRMIEDRLLDLGRDPVGMGPLGAGQPVDQPLGPVG